MFGDSSVYLKEWWRNIHEKETRTLENPLRTDENHSSGSTSNAVKSG